MKTLTKNEEIEALAEKALEILREYGRGQVVPHSVLSVAIGMEPSAYSAYYRVVHKARRMLRDRDGVWSKPERDAGFRLYTEVETFTDEARSRAKRARRQLGIAVRAAVAVPAEGLSFNMRRLREATIKGVAESRRRIETKHELAEKAAKPRDASPRMVRIQPATVSQPGA